ncbi:MAG: HlyD family secretion protein [Candidatus Latescibacterota bacterium]|nr:MAG: HlyD family secretion protein [Candidatus Latescibacterota bacterium]
MSDERNSNNQEPTPSESKSEPASDGKPDPGGGGKSAGESTSKSAGKKTDPIRRITAIVLAVCLVILIWYVLSDRLTPHTDQAKVVALVVPIVPQVSGYLTEVDVRLHSVVNADDRLFQIDKRPYELAVRSAEANLDRAAQQVGARTATVKSAAARLGVAKAQLDRAQRNYNRTQQVLENNPGALSQADWDRAETSLAQAVERVASSEADLETAKEQLGAVGPDNPDLRSAIVALEQAQLDLAFSTIYAPSRGVIESFNVDVGHYAQAGQPLATFISTHDVWIQADMRENNISNIKVGNRVEFVLDVAPGRVFRGEVRSVGYGVGSQNPTNRGQLQTVTSSKGWLRDPQRFPVIIGFETDETARLLRIGGQADVVVYTGNYHILNAISWVNLRVRGILSYVR